MEENVILSQRDNINKAFKSLIKSGRPEVRDDNNNDMLSEIYVDLVEGDYFLNLAMDDNHTIFKGRRGTGKSTVFIQAEKKLKERKDILPIYINLQSCYENIRQSDGVEQDDLNKWNTYKNFFNEVLSAVKDNCNKRFHNNSAIKALFDQIEKGEYIDADFQRTLKINETQKKEKGFSVEGIITDIKNVGFKANGVAAKEKEQAHDGKEMRIYSINKILKQLTDILQKENICKVYLFLDDFSELEQDAQQLIVDSLMSPIISSYNEYFVVKLAAYPYRIYLGNIDSNKITQYSLDFYDVYEKSATNYKEVEALAVDYVKRTIAKRIEIFTGSQLNADELFDTSKTPIELYYKTLFYASAGIPRCLGYILDYSFLGSIHQGKQITLSNIDNSAKKYFLDNIYPDFYSDVRYKQSFLDDGKILSQITQKKLMTDFVKISRAFKRDQIKMYTSGKPIKEIYKDTINKYRTSNGYWLPSSHFSIEKDIEALLQTLELYYIVNKFNEGSNKRKPGIKMSYYGLNYGLCLEKAIDYGKPELRRSYDYWRMDEFDYTDIIPKLLSGNTVPKCSNCGYEYTDESELKITKKFGYCLSCKAVGTVSEGTNIDSVLEQQIEKWREIGLPDLQMGILRILFNKKDLGEEQTAMSIAGELDIHHAAITKSCDKLKRLGYVDFKTEGVRHYRITNDAIKVFFETDEDNDEIDLEE